MQLPVNSMQAITIKDSPEQQVTSEEKKTAQNSKFTLILKALLTPIHLYIHYMLQVCIYVTLHFLVLKRAFFTIIINNITKHNYRILCACMFTVTAK